MEPDDIGDISLPAASALPDHDSSQINISDVIAAIQTADPTSTLGMFATNPTGGGGTGQPPQLSPNLLPIQQPTNNPTNAVGSSDPQQTAGQRTNTANNIRQSAYVRISEQPAGKALRFRYECEGRSAGSIPGVNSTPENRTFPTIQVHGYRGKAVVVVSCVTKDPPYRPHPHNLVGREGCRRGVCTVEINSETMSVVFSNLGIQCVKRKDIEAALRLREEIRVDPFRTGFSHRSQASGIDLNAVRLCFQVFLEGERGRFTVPLTPVVSDPIYDKKAMSDLVICKLSDCSCTVAGGKEIILLCEKVAREDIAVRFFEEREGQIVWEAFGDFQHTNVHKQVAISFRTPKYVTLEVQQPVKVYIQLKRPSDGATSEALPFDYLPLDSGRRQYWTLRKSFRDKPDMNMFQRILLEDKELSNKVESNGILPNQKQNEVIVLDTPTDEIKPLTEEAKLLEKEIDTIIKERAQEIETDEKENFDLNNLQQNPIEKTSEWIKSSEFERIDFNNGGGFYDSPNSAVSPSDGIVPVVSRNDSNTDHDQMLSDEDKTLNDLLEQVAELDEIYSDHHLRRNDLDNAVTNELNNIDNCLPKHTTAEQMDIDDLFDDTATYTSLQKAFRNPVHMIDIMPPTPPPSQPTPEEMSGCDVSEIIVSPPAPIIDVTSLKRESVSREEEKLPPLPPKRIRKQENNENRPLSANENNMERSNSSKSLTLRPQSQFIIMKTPDQSPPSKKLPTPPNNVNSNTLPKQKKPGFFSKLFSRRKSKSDLSSDPNLAVPNSTTPSQSREPSIISIPLHDPNRSSVRSVKSLQPTSNSSSRFENKGKKSKPVGRSVSSVSGKRPHLTADVIHIPLKGDSSNSLPMNEEYSNASTVTLSNNMDRKTVSALQLADLPLQDGNMELIAIADAQSLKNLCEGKYGVQLDPSVDLTEAEHYALYTSVPPQATASEFDDTSCYYAPVEAGEILTPAEVAERLNSLK